MVYRRRINIDEMAQLLATNMTYEEIGRRFGVHKSSICKAVKQYRHAQGKSVVIQSTEGVTRKNIDAMEKLNEVMATVGKELKFVTEQMDTVTKAWNRMEEEIKAKVPTVEDVKALVMIQESRKDWESSQLKYIEETRKQVGLVKDLMAMSYNMDEIEKFKEIILYEIGLESQECRQRIFDRIRQQRTRRGLFEVSRSTV
jgi:hypothetical protein